MPAVRVVCPECLSERVVRISSDDEFGCRDCGHAFRQEPIDLPPKTFDPTGSPIKIAKDRK